MNFQKSTRKGVFLILIIVFWLFFIGINFNIFGVSEVSGAYDYNVKKCTNKCENKGYESGSCQDTKSCPEGGTRISAGGACSPDKWCCCEPVCPFTAYPVPIGKYKYFCVEGVDDYSTVGLYDMSGSYVTSDTADSSGCGEIYTDDYATGVYFVTGEVSGTDWLCKILISSSTSECRCETTTTSTTTSTTTTSTTTTSTITECNLCNVRNLNCPSSVAAGSSFSISYEIYGTGPNSYPYEVQTIKDKTESCYGYSSDLPCACYYTENNQECTWHYKSRSLTAPSSTGTYTYEVKCYGASSIDSNWCGSEDDSMSCTIDIITSTSTSTTSTATTSTSISTTSTIPDCSAYNCDWDCCTNYGPCDVDEGDCDGDGECMSGLTCRQDVGNEYGCSSTFDVCGTTTSTSTTSTSSSTTTTCTPTVCNKGSWQCNGDCQRKRRIYEYDPSCNCDFDHWQYSNCPRDTACSGGSCVSNEECSISSYKCKNSCTKGKKKYRCDGSNHCDEFWTWTSTSSCNPYTCSGGSCTSTCSQSCGAECDSDSDCNSDGWYCDSGNVKEYRDYYCSGSCSCEHSDSQRYDCDNKDGWYDTSSWNCDEGCRRCKDQEYRNYRCSGGGCTYSVTNTREKCENAPQGQRCSGGSFTSSGYCDYGSWSCNGDCQRKRKRYRCDGSNHCDYKVNTQYQNAPQGKHCSGEVFFEENWEDGNDNGWIPAHRETWGLASGYNCGWGVTSSGHYGTKGSYSLQLGGTSRVTSQSFDLTGASDVSVTYYESGWSFDGEANYCENARLDFYDGSTWHNDLIHSQEDHFDWRKRSYNIPDSWLSSNNKIRFTFEDNPCDGCCCGDYWWIDNIQIKSASWTSSGQCDYSGWSCDGDCRKQRHAYECDGSNHCDYHDYWDYSNCPSDTVCSGGSCVNDQPCSTGGYECKDQCTQGKRQYRCDGSNNCNEFWRWVSESSCNPYQCSGGSCSNTCESNCGADSSCDGKASGESCGAGLECNSNCECVDVCFLDSASITSSCSGGSSSDCEQGETIQMTGAISGGGCSIDHFQIDASNGNCNIEYSGGDLSGIYGDSPSQTSTSVSGSWTIPSIPDKCKGKTISATFAGIYEGGGPGTGAWLGGASASGSFKFACPPLPVINSFTINNDDAYTSSKDVTLQTSSNADECRWKNEGGTWSSWDSSYSTKQWTLPSGDGVKKVYVKCKETVCDQTVTDSDTITLDQSPPQVNGYTDPSTPVGGNSTMFYGEGSDPDSGINSIELRIEDKDGVHTKSCSSSSCDWGPKTYSAGDSINYSVLVENNAGLTNTFEKEILIACSGIECLNLTVQKRTFSTKPNVVLEIPIVIKSLSINNETVELKVTGWEKGYEFDEASCNTYCHYSGPVDNVKKELTIEVPKLQGGNKGSTSATLNVKIPERMIPGKYNFVISGTD